MHPDSLTYIYDYNRDSLNFSDSLVQEHLYINAKDDSTSIYLSFKEVKSEPEKEATGHAGIRHVFSLEHVDGIFALLLISFLFLTRIFKGGFHFFKENSRLVFTSRENLSLFSETTVTEFWYNFALLFQSALLAAIIAFSFCLDIDNMFVPVNGFLTILLFLVCICLVEFIKYLFYKLMGFVFNMKSVIDIWLRSYILIIEMMGIIAFVPVLILVYSNHYQEILTYFFIILFIVSRLIIFYRIIIFFLREDVNLLYLIAYLCSVEIFPYFLLYKGLTYLYKIDIISLLWH